MNNETKRDVFNDLLEKLADAYVALDGEGIGEELTNEDKQAYHQYKDKPLEGQLRCDVKVYRSIQASTNNKQRRLKEQGIVRPIVKGDIDNYFKAVTDPLSKIVWKDDAQIVEGFIGKYYSENPRIEMTISQV